MWFEASVAQHCGAAMAGIKPASLAVCDAGQAEEMYRFRSAFLKKGIRLEVIARRGERFTYLVFREEKLREHLSREENSAFLSEYGYPEGLEARLLFLKVRMLGKCYPHEVGIFLGYPAEDILGYMRNPGGCIFSGAWKVYSEPEKKRALFARYKKCSGCIVRRLACGETLAEIFR